MVHVGRPVEEGADAVAEEEGHVGALVPARSLVDDVADPAEVLAGPANGERALHALLGHARQPQPVLVHRAHADHVRAVAVEAIEEDSEVDVDDAASCLRSGYRAPPRY